MDVATDGEMRRSIFFEFFVSGLEGLSPLPGLTVRFHGKRPEDAMQVQILFTVTGTIAPRPCPGLEELRYARERTRLPVKVTLRAR